MTIDPHMFAHELAEKCGLCGEAHQAIYGKHSLVCERLEYALRTARNDGIEDAAVLISHGKTKTRMYLAKAIRALKEVDYEKKNTQANHVP